MPSAKKQKVDLQPVDSSVVPRYAEIATLLRAPGSTSPVATSAT
ncbi:MAG TPA: hypothetical protein VKF59_18075 [Candidatus Dormibacteraeota bacterium]|nr:hypothetical protein [Candidatus Dormibacteraeota bacterium]